MGALVFPGLGRNFGHRGAREPEAAKCALVGHQCRCVQCATRRVALGQEAAGWGWGGAQVGGGQFGTLNFETVRTRFPPSPAAVEQAPPVVGGSPPTCDGDDPPAAGGSPAPLLPAWATAASAGPDAPAWSREAPGPASGEREVPNGPNHAQPGLWPSRWPPGSCVSMPPRGSLFVAPAPGAGMAVALQRPSVGGAGGRRKGPAPPPAHSCAGFVGPSKCGGDGGDTLAMPGPPESATGGLGTSS